MSKEKWNKKVMLTIKSLREIIPLGDNFEKRLSQRKIEVDVGTLLWADARIAEPEEKGKRAEDVEEMLKAVGALSRWKATAVVRYIKGE